MGCPSISYLKTRVWRISSTGTGGMRFCSLLKAFWALLNTGSKYLGFLGRISKRTLPRHEGGHLRPCRCQDVKGRARVLVSLACPRSPHQPFSPKAHNQPRQMRPRLLHEDMARESHFPSSGPTLRSFLAPRKVGKKVLAKETQGGD